MRSLAHSWNRSISWSVSRRALARRMVGFRSAKVREDSTLSRSER
jgi:hypothetical protein